MGEHERLVKEIARHTETLVARPDADRARDALKSAVRTLAELAGPATVILLAHGNGAAPGVQQMRGRFYELLERERFAVARVERSALHADHRRGVELHCVTRR